MHYNDPQHANATPLEHQNLPFSKANNHRAPAFQILLDFINVNPQTAYTCLREIDGVDYRFSYPSIAGLSIWQPPKI